MAPMPSKRKIGVVAVAMAAMVVLAGIIIWGQGASATEAPLRVPILMYHYVDETPPDAGPHSADLTVPTAQFEAEMDYLAANGYHPVTLEEVYGAMAGKGWLPTKPVALTFDDGGLDNYTVAFPILQKHGFRATFFVITGSVGDPVCMDWEQLRVMHAAGMDIESHTVDHPDLRALDAARLAEELSRSRAVLATELGADSLILAYPQGRYNGTVIVAAQAAGYLAAVTTRLWWTSSSPSRYEWQRTRVSPGESLGAFGRALEGARWWSIW